MLMRRKVLSVQIGRMFGAVAVATSASLAVPSYVLAQSADGSIYGTAPSGAQVTIQNAESGLSRNATADSKGAFSFSRIPPGNYKVSTGAVTRDVVVSMGTGTQVTLEEEATQRIQVVGTNVRSGIDVASVESSTVFTAAQIQALPVPRSVNSVALLAPGVVMGDGDFTDDSESAARLPAFGGASVAENGYYINGLDVTNIRNFLSYANLPFDAIAEQQMKSGGYGAEYGRSLGGVISLLTKRGTNEWKGGASMYWEPQALRSEGKNVADKEPSRPGRYTVYEKPDEEDNLSVNVYGGGPLVKDKLFVFGLIEGRRDVTKNYGQNQSSNQTSDKPNGMIKVEFTPSDMHHLEFTGISNEKRVRIADYTNSQPYSTSNDGSPAISERTSGGSVKIGKYTGYLTDDLTVSALVGEVKHLRSKTTGARMSGQTCPVVLDEGLNEVGCWAPPFPGEPVNDPAAPDNKDKRNSWRFDVDYVMGTHTLKGGLDHQKFVSWEAGGSTYSGGVYYRYYAAPPTGSVNGVPHTDPYIRARVLQSTTGSYSVENDAYYIEDSWRPNRYLSLYGGLRWESFNNKNGDGESFVKADNLLAPRLGASFDPTGNAGMKVYGTWGRYYIPVAANSNVRMTRGEIFRTTYYGWGGGRDPVTQAPVGPLTQLGNVVVSSDGSLPDPATVADTKLQPMSQDELILGIQKAIVPGWTAGVKFINREVKNGMDDWCDTAALGRWAADNGYTNYDYHTAATCMLVNPGRDVNVKLDLNNDGTYRDATIPASYTGLSEYKRKYDALEFTLEKAWDGKWALQGSYTYSKSRGTTEGYVNSITNQDDAGVSQEFDFGSFTHGADGYLPNDRRHIFKLFGSYAVTSEFRVGANFTAASGRPISCIGFVPTTVGDYAGSGAYSTASSFYCLDNTGTTRLVQRGTSGRTPWTYQMDLQLAYTAKLPSQDKLTLQLDIFNVFNNREVIEVDETRDYSRATSVTPPGQQSMNYGSPTAFQQARYARISARWEF